MSQADHILERRPIEKMQELLGELSAPVETLLQTPGDQAVYHALVRWLEQVAEHASFYRTMLGKGGNAALAAQLLGHLETMVLAEARRQQGDQAPGTPQRAITRRFIAAGFLGVTEWWLNQRQPLAVHEVASQLHALLKAVIGTPSPA